MSRRRSGARRAPAALVFVGAALAIAAAVSARASDGGTAGRTTSPGAADTSTTSPGAADERTTTSAVAAPSGSALAALDQLAVKGRAPKTGYSRDLFGYRTVDVDHNGCDARNDVLRRDLADVTVKPGTQGCVVATGTLHDPYTGTTIAFTRGTTTSEAVQIDHVVALSDAWQTGAQSWDPTTLVRFGNDPLELLAVSGPANDEKGDGDAATWLPPSTAYRCTYVARQVAVKLAYRLWVTPAEHDAIARVLSSCPAEPLPTAAPVPAPQR